MLLVLLVAVLATICVASVVAEINRESLRKEVKER
jgi:hypothetical protein